MITVSLLCTVLASLLQQDDVSEANLKALVAQLSDDAIDVRSRATEELRKLPLAAIPKLEQCLAQAVSTEVRARLESILVEKRRQQRSDAALAAWSDARFWITQHGRRMGWVHYVVRPIESDGKSLVAIDYERAGYGELDPLSVERVTVHAHRDDTLTAKGVFAGTLPHPFADFTDPRHSSKTSSAPIVHFPALVASQLPFTMGTTLTFRSVGYQRQPERAESTLRYMGEERMPATDADNVLVHRIRADERKKAPSGQTAVIATDFWFDKDRRLLRSHSAWTGEDWQGKPLQYEWTLERMSAAEWNVDSVVVNEFRAACNLKLIYSAATLMRAADLDGNLTNDYWVGDVSAYFRLLDANRRKPLELIPRGLAQADGAPLKAGPEDGGASLGEALAERPIPYFGYLFKALSRQAGQPLHQGKNRNNRAQLAFCAYPAGFGKSGRRTFIIAEDGVVFWKDVGSHDVDDYPKNPGRGGWTNGPLER
ncbi:MAG: DUF2950 family protein [Planctomycetes bacterium]|nr:DUF2950 family protein [Planctomycetota bacterium]